MEIHRTKCYDDVPTARHDGAAHDVALHCGEHGVVAGILAFADYHIAGGFAPHLAAHVEFDTHFVSTC